MIHLDFLPNIITSWTNSVNDLSVTDCVTSSIPDKFFCPVFSRLIGGSPTSIFIISGFGYILFATMLVNVKFFF